MKLTAIFLFVSCLMAGMKGTAQTVTLSVKNAKLETVLSQFKKQTGYSFFYDELIFTKSPNVNLELNKTPLKEAVELCFNQQPDLLYKFFGNTVVITKKNTLPAENAKEPGQVLLGPSGIEVKGIVFNKRHETLANASVMVRGSQKGTLTMADGSFKLDGLKPEDVLRISFIGYSPVEIAIKDNLQMQIVLEETTNELDQVVAQGYSNTTKRLSTNSVYKVTSEEINRRPVTNPLLALQGRVQGLAIAPATGYAAGPIKMQVRGRSLLSTASSSPLILIDGIPVNMPSGTGRGDGPVKSDLGAFSPAMSQSPLFGLNPNDIESIEVLQDLGATAIYGSYGANGVILIKTKKPKAGVPELTVRINTAISKITRYWDLLNTQQYLEMRREAFRNDGIIPTPQNAPDLLRWDTTRYTNWQKELWGGIGHRTSAEVSLSGGSGQFTQRISANYSSSKEIAALNGNKTMGVTIGLSAMSKNKKFVASLSASFISSHVEMSRFPTVSLLPPNAPSFFDENGNINYKDWNEAGDEVNKMNLAVLVSPMKSKTNSILSNLTLSYQLAKGLSLQTTIGFSSNQNSINAQTPIYAQNPRQNPTGNAEVGKSTMGNLTITPQLNYSTWLFGQGKLDILVGGRYNSANEESLSISGRGYTNDALLKSISSAPFLQTRNTSTASKNIGVLASINYVWSNKYVLSMTGNRDGSSKYGPGNRFGNYGSVGLAWVASDEPWLKKMLQPVVSFLKFHWNTGLAGNSGGMDYAFLSRWGKPYLLPQYDNKIPIVSTQAVNPDYHWQEVKEQNFGTTINFFKNQLLTLDISYFRKTVGKQLIPLPTPYFTGFKTVLGNENATVQNSGWAFTVSAPLISREKFSWTASFNTGFNRNKMLSFPGIEYSDAYYSFLPGRSMDETYLLNYLGVDPLTGIYQFQDYNHDGMVSGVLNPTAPLSGTNDVQRVLNLAPKFSGGMGHDFTFRNFTLNLLFDFTSVYGTNAYFSLDNPGTMSNIPVEFFNSRWQKPGDNALYSKFSTVNNQSFDRMFSTLNYSDASYIRLTSFSFMYTFSPSLLKKWDLKGGSFSINSSNLFTITRYKGIDPEVQSFQGMPPVRTINAALSITL